MPVAGTRCSWQTLPLTIATTWCSSTGWISPRRGHSDWAAQPDARSSTRLTSPSRGPCTWRPISRGVRCCWCALTSSSRLRCGFPRHLWAVGACLPHLATSAHRFASVTTSAVASTREIMLAQKRTAIPGSTTFGCGCRDVECPSLHCSSLHALRAQRSTAICMLFATGSPTLRWHGSIMILLAPGTPTRTASPTHCTKWQGAKNPASHLSASIFSTTRSSARCARALVSAPWMPGRERLAELWVGGRGQKGLGVHAVAASVCDVRVGSSVVCRAG